MKLIDRAHDWLFDESLCDDQADRAQLAMARTACVIGIIGFALYSSAHGADGSPELAAICLATSLAFAANLVALQVHGSVGAFTHALAVVFTAGETGLVAYSGNLAEAVPMWGMVPVATAILLRHRRDVVIWLGLFAIICAVQIELSDPEAFNLPLPYVDMVIGVLAYGSMALAHVYIREWARTRLAAAKATTDRLSALVPICSYCKQIRDDEGYWHGVEQYLVDHSGAELTHGICPGCLEEQKAQLLADDGE